MFKEIAELIEAVKRTNKILPKLLWAFIIANIVNILTLLAIVYMILK